MNEDPAWPPEHLEPPEIGDALVAELTAAGNPRIERLWKHGPTLTVLCETDRPGDVYCDPGQDKEYTEPWYDPSLLMLDTTWDAPDVAAMVEGIFGELGRPVMAAAWAQPSEINWAEVTEIMERYGVTTSYQESR